VVTTGYELSVFYIQKYVVGPSGLNFILIQQTFVHTDNALFHKSYSGIVVVLPCFNGRHMICPVGP
jgi:hypothetical protein